MKRPIHNKERSSDRALWRRVLAEYVGSCFLAAVVIGSGIAAATLSPNDVGVELLENALVTGAGLFSLILIFGPVSGAHFNPLVSIVDAIFGSLSWRYVGAYLVAQIAGCSSGALLANAMFHRSIFELSTKNRSSGAHWIAEVVATIGLLLVIFSLAHSKRSQYVPAGVGAYIGAAYFFTSSTSFANPAITIGRMLSNSFAGIAPSSAPGFIVAQLVGAGVSVALLKALYPGISQLRGINVLQEHTDDTHQHMSPGERP
jgi:arsenate reductase